MFNSSQDIFLNKLLHFPTNLDDEIKLRKMLMFNSSLDILLNKSLDSLINYDDELTKPWNYKLEFTFIILIGALSIPANLLLFLFYVKKMHNYKRLYAHAQNQKHIVNSFYTYLIEMATFDTFLVVYLILDVSFKFLSSMDKSPYESVYDVSNFTCKFFIYVVRISSAMSNYLVCLLAINRSMLTSRRLQEYRVCFNTKYLTLFVFCVCTIANVFRLEQLRLYSNKQLTKKSTKLIISEFSLLQKYLVGSLAARWCCADRF